MIEESGLWRFLRGPVFYKINFQKKLLLKDHIYSFSAT
jgi:hypothetical protein